MKEGVKKSGRQTLNETEKRESEKVKKQISSESERKEAKIVENNRMRVKETKTIRPERMTDISRMKYKTRGDSSPQGKERVFFTCHPADFEPYFDTVCGEIFKTQNCVIWYDGDQGNSWTAEEMELELVRMQLFVIPVTAGFLYEDNTARNVLFRFAAEHHIPVLPLMQESGLESDFNRICGDLQFLDKNAAQTDPTALPYEQKLERFLSSVLLGDELAEKVRKAFDAYIFLSYRKKDRKYAQELMRLIHQNEFCRDIAIWYDEFLVPGEDFNHSIQDAMEKSELFTFVVTPNLLENDNYVMTVEYPVAKETGKPILPAEMVPTDRAQLQKDYQEIPDPADAHNAPVLSDALQKGLRDLAITESHDDPVHLFFIGLAYLNGIDVEENRERGAQLIETAANANLPEAMEKLSQMYQNGEGVARNYAASAQWLERLIAYWKNQYDKSGTREDGNNWLRAAQSLCALMTETGQLEQSKKQIKDTLQVIEALKSFMGEAEYYDKLAGCYSTLADTCLHQKQLAEAWGWCGRFLAILEPFEKSGGFKETTLAVAYCYTLMGDVYKAAGDVSKAKEYGLHAAARFEQASLDITGNNREMISFIYGRLADYCLALSESSEAFEWMSRANYLCEKAYAELQNEEQRKNLSSSYTKLAGLYSILGKTQKAGEYYYKALELAEQNYQATERYSEGQVLSQVYITLCDHERQQGRPAKAKEFLEKCLCLCGQLIQTGDVAWTKIMCRFEMGSLLQEENRLSEAKDSYFEAVSIADTVYQNSERSIEYKSVLLGCYMGLQAVAVDEKQWAEAKKWQGKEIELQEQMYRQAGNQTKQIDLLQTYQEMTDLCIVLTEFDEAKEWCQKSIELCGGLNGKTDSVEVRQMLSTAYKKMGMILKEEGKLSEAKNCYKKHYKVDLALCTASKEIATVDFWDDMAIDSYNAGIMDRDHPDMSMIHEAETIWEQFAEVIPDEPCYAERLQKARNATAAAMKKYELPASERSGSRTGVSQKSDRADLNEYMVRANQGDLKAQMNLAYFYLTGDGVAKNAMQAYYWALAAAKQDNVSAWFNLGLYFANGYGVRQSYSEASQWFEMAAEQGYVKAQFNLGVYYANGTGVVKDDELATYWFLEAAKQGDPLAQFNLAGRYRYGLGVEANAEEAVSLYTKLAQEGDSQAEFMLGGCYENGEGVKKDYTQALAWYKKAAGQGMANAQFAVGSYYEDGLGVPRDYVQAAEWYYMAVQQGDEKAKKNLMDCWKNMPQPEKDAWTGKIVALQGGGMTESKQKAKGTGKNSSAAKAAPAPEKKEKGKLFKRFRKN